MKVDGVMKVDSGIAKKLFFFLNFFGEKRGYRRRQKCVF